MFEYNICNEADEDIFKKQCLALEKNIPNLVKKDLVIDVDGSKIQEYVLRGAKITAINNKYLGEVQIISEVDLEQFFN